MNDIDILRFEDLFTKAFAKLMEVYDERENKRVYIVKWRFANNELNIDSNEHIGEQEFSRDNYNAAFRFYRSKLKLVLDGFIHQ